MDLSIIIVNYNVKFFLEQCLHSVIKAIKNIDAEIIVVDNNSVDGSTDMIRQKFPSLKLIENKVNAGFSKANNQALAIAEGKYCLLLNPDTIVEDSSFEKCIEFMEEHPEAGAIGVKMIDGKARFLPESKRSFPGPAVAFYKIFGLTALFPRSERFGRYYASHLSNNEIGEVDVLSGAFMFIRKKTLELTGLLDEDYFMYGEDIDLSFRIKKAGYKNYYFPETTIIHYKGESTKKESLKYVILFYKAMIIFYKKHLAEKNFQLFQLFIYLAIFFRAGISILKRFFLAVYQPIIDGLLIASGFAVILGIFRKYHFGFTVYPETGFLIFYISIFIIALLISVFLAGGYKQPVRLSNYKKGFMSGAIILFLINFLLPENIKFDSIILLAGIISGLILILFYRLLIFLLFVRHYKNITE